MLSALMIVAGLSALFSLTARTVARRLNPPTAAFVFTVASVTIAAASSGLLAVAGWYGAARFGPIATAGGWSPRLLARTAPLPLPVSMCAGLGIAAITLRVAHLWFRRVRELRAAQRSWRPAGHDQGITVTAEQRVDAFAVEETAKTRRIVLTERLLRAIPDPDLQRAVIEHEQCTSDTITFSTARRRNGCAYQLDPATHHRCRPAESLEAWADDPGHNVQGQGQPSRIVKMTGSFRAGHILRCSPTMLSRCPGRWVAGSEDRWSWAVGGRGSERVVG